jgi:hypothetical protein
MVDCDLRAGGSPVDPEVSRVRIKEIVRGSLASVEGGWRAAAGSQSATWNRLREKVLFFLKIA